MKKAAYSLSIKQLGTSDVLLEFGDYRMHFKESLVLFRPVIFFSLVFLNLVNCIYRACLELPLPLAVKDLES